MSGCWLRFALFIPSTRRATAARGYSTSCAIVVTRSASTGWRLMRENGIWARVRRRFRHTTDSNHRLPVAPNLLEQNFTATAPNQAWVGDITYIWTAEGWAYLAVLLDLYSRRVVGRALRKSLSREVAMAALDHALTCRRPPPGLVHHTDRGSQ